MTSEPKSRQDNLPSRILDAMEPGVRYARADLIDDLGVSVAEWKQAVADLVERECVRRTGSRRGTRYELIGAEAAAAQDLPTALSGEAHVLYDAMEPGQEYARKDLLETTGLSVSAWNRVINELVDTGLVEREGERSKTRYVRPETDDEAGAAAPAAAEAPAATRPDAAPVAPKKKSSSSSSSSSPRRAKGRFEVSVAAIRDQIGLDDDVHVEALLAARGFPTLLWPTISALANSGQGALVLGARKRNDEVCYIKGVRKPLIAIQRLRRLIADDHVVRGIDTGEIALEVVELAQRKVIVLRITDRAADNIRPVYVGDNAYTRLPHEGTFALDPVDGVRKCSVEEIDAMWDAWATPHRIRRGEVTAPSLEELDEDGPIVDTLLREIAGPARRHPRLAEGRLQECIVRACGVRPLTLDELSELLDRKASRLQREHLETLLELKRIVRVDDHYCIHSTQLSQN